MKSILIIGTSDSGKSTTMREVCKRLMPQRVYRLYPNRNTLKNSTLELTDTEAIFNDTFIIEVNGKLILVVAGATTEQNIRITVLIEICIELELNISFALVSMRSFERRESFDTRNELMQKSKIILAERIYQIDGVNFKQSKEWNSRVDRIVELIKSNI